MRINQWILDMGKLKKKIIAWLEKILPYMVYRYIIYLWRRMKLIGKEWSYHEEYFLKWRPFSKEKYYIVRLEYQSFGIFSAAENYILAAERASQKGMCPLMALLWKDDLKNDNLVGINEWETVFRQRKIGEIVDRNATILVSRVNSCDILHISNNSLDNKFGSLATKLHTKEDNWRNYYKNAYKYVKKYWRFNQYIIKKTNRKFTEMFQCGEKILGVALRENFSKEYNELITNVEVKKVYRHHPLGPNVSEILDIVEDCLKKWGCDKIFIATRYSDSIKKFEQRFQGKVIYCERKRTTIAEAVDVVNARKKFIDDAMSKNLKYRDETRKITKDYVQETILLSKCTYLIGAKSGQTIAALSLNGGQYKNIKILYDNNNVKSY